MHKFLSGLIFAGALAFPCSAMCAFVGPDDAVNAGGFSGPYSNAQADTVAKAKELADDAPVVLTGNIVSQVAGKKNSFIFRDQTGDIRVKIGKKVFAGQNVTPHDRVQISGRVDKDWGEDMKIKVKQLKIVR